MGCRSSQVPRPHISVAWALGDISNSLKKVFEGERRRSAVGRSLQKINSTASNVGLGIKYTKYLHLYLQRFFAGIVNDLPNGHFDNVLVVDPRVLEAKSDITDPPSKKISLPPPGMPLCRQWRRWH
ncbi:hypothetical protein DVH24_022792 [Malus domestica]|uniref:Uncharacterized protein n=1 Tax=Malus domestica TaxID=3750 RepID=A0A498KLM8_MALDO|nr:hypothetical protein DVH24_022792 [Malus domestica]